MKAEATYHNNIAPSTARKVSWHDYFALTKPTITLLVVVTVIPSLLLASPDLPGPLLILCALAGAMFSSASAAVFNQLIESDLDGHMQRTQRRSVATGRVSKGQATAFGCVLGGLGLGLLYFGTTPLAAACAGAGHLFYVLIYTAFLKKRTAQNIVIGGAAGAVGPLIGWAAVSNEIAWPAWILFLIIFLWTPPHFWALAIKYKDDYAQAGIPMYPVIYGDHKTRRMMFVYTLGLLPCIFVLFMGGAAGVVFLALSLAFTGKFCYDAWRIYQDGNNEKVMPFFHYSCFYTFGIFGALAFDRLLYFLIA